MGRTDLVTGPRICLVRLHIYQLTKRKAMERRAKFDTLLENVNTVLRRYENDHEELLDRLKDIQRQIQYLTKGVASGALDMRRMLDVEDGEQSDQNRRFLCRRYYKELAQHFHPDKGGDVDHFQSLYGAYVNNDLDYLLIQYQLWAREPRLSWRCEEGVEFWQDQYETVKTRHQRLMIAEAYGVARFHVSRQFEKASLAMGEFLKRKLKARQIELQYMIQNPSTENYDG